MPLTPDEVNARTFQPTKFREGYDQAEVDDFLDEVVAELRRLHTDNDELREQLAVCEKRAAELSRASAASAPKQSDRASVAALNVGGGGKGHAAGDVPVPAERQPAAKAEQAPAAASGAASGAAPAAASGVAPAAASAESAASGETSPSSGVQEAAGMLALAQRLHDEHVRTGERERDRLVGEAKAHADRLVGEAEKKKNDTLTALERERSGLEHIIDKLKDFERDYRSQLKSYLESQMRDLEAQPSLMPGRPPHEAASARA